MRLLIATDEHYISEGASTYSEDGATPYIYWREYLKVFEEVLVFARVRRDPSFIARPAALANGPDVRFLEVPYFRGPRGYIQMRSALHHCAGQAVNNAEAFLVRVPGMMGTAIAKAVRRSGRSFAAQVVGDPWQVFGVGGVGGLLGPIYRLVSRRDLRRVCREADLVWYVTQQTLQCRYPPSASAFVTAWSDVQLKEALAGDDEIAERLESITKLRERTKVLGWLGSLQQPYKKADVLLKAVAICTDRGIDLRVRFAGGGRLQPEYERLARELGIAEKTEFLGQIGAGTPVYRFLDSLDLFVMPSPVEGLPRAMVEAMARGCPCIGSDAGGIPELLCADALVKPLDPEALANKIMEKLARPDDLVFMAKRNRAEADKYSPERVVEARLAFLTAMRERAQRHGGSSWHSKPASKSC